MPRAGWKKPVSDRRLSDLVSVGVLTRVFPPDLVDEVIAGAGRTEQRHRSLPARVMAYFSIGMALYCDGSYEDVLGQCFGSWCWRGSSSPPARKTRSRVLTEPGVEATSYRTMKRRLPVYATEQWRHGLVAACAAHAALGPASLVLYDVSTLYFETDAGDGFREPRFSKERRLEPQITLGLLTDATGFPLMVQALEGNKAETKTMLPVITTFMAAHALTDVTVVADAGMISQANQTAIEAAGLSFILGTKIPEEHYPVGKWRREHPGQAIPDGQVFTQPWPAGPNQQRRDQVIYYQYRAGRVSLIWSYCDGPGAKSS